MTRLADLTQLLLGPIERAGPESWTAAPPGAWSAGRIVAHVALAMEKSAEAFEARREHAPMSRRPPSLQQRLGRMWLLTTGNFVRPRRAPQHTEPAEAPERAATEARLRAVVERWLKLERELAPRRRDLFVKHPVLGDLDLGEWVRFHVVHGEHHARQIRGRVRTVRTG